MKYPFTSIIIFPLLRLFIRKATGLENLPKKGGFVIAANHESYLDSYIIGAVIIPKIDKQIHFLTLKTGFGIKLVGEKIAHDWAGDIFLEKGKEKEALDEAVHVLKKGGIVGIYPGGRTSKRLRKGKTGAVRMALRAKVPIVPIGLIGTYKIAPKERRIFSLRRCELNIGKPIYMDKYYNKKITKALLRKLTDDLMLEIARLTGKKYLYMGH